MIHAIYSTALLVALAQHVGATGLQYNPVTQCGEFVPLNSQHPAYGAELASNSLTAVLTSTAPEEPVALSLTLGDLSSNGSDSSANGKAQAFDALNGTAPSRRLEDSSPDLQRLEHFYGSTMQRNTQQLPQRATYATIPWPSSYWPVYQDSINYRWNPSQPSPAEKYATAFGLDVRQFMDQVSQTNGIMAQSSRPQCISNQQCSGSRDGSVCARRPGESSGYCIPAWFGICHAWAPAALLEPEPKCAVERNGVVFQPFDIKGLLTIVYDGVQLQTVFTGARFNGPDYPENKDQYGRYRDPARRDLGPGFFHIALGNIIGLLKKSFVMDVTAGAEVWNQPVYGYEVLQQQRMRPSDAARRYYRTSRYPFNDQAVQIMYVQTRVTWMVEETEDGPLVSTGRARRAMKTGTYTYLLELDNQDNIIGGEWVGKSHDDHPDFLWVPADRPAPNTISRLGVDYAKVSSLLTESVNCAGATLN